MRALRVVAQSLLQEGENGYWQKVFPAQFDKSIEEVQSEAAEVAPPHQVHPLFQRKRFQPRALLRQGIAELQQYCFAYRLFTAQRLCRDADVLRWR